MLDCWQQSLLWKDLHDNQKDSCERAVHFIYLGAQFIYRLQTTPHIKLKTIISDFPHSHSADYFNYSVYVHLKL